MSNELTIIAPQNLTEAREMSSILAKSSLLSDGFRGKEADVLMIIMMGAELGMRPMQSLASFDLIKGKLGMKPVAMIALVRAHHSIEYLECVESSASSVTWTSKRKAGALVLCTTFTMAQAQAAGLLSSDMYKKWPEQMLTWRCAAIHCRKNHSDITMGQCTTEEVESFDVRVEPAAKPTIIEQAQKPAPVVETQFTPAASPPKAAPSDPLAAEVASLSAAIAAAETKEALDALRKRLSALPEKEKTALRYDYGQRAAELKGKVTT